MSLNFCFKNILSKRYKIKNTQCTHIYKNPLQKFCSTTFKFNLILNKSRTIQLFPVHHLTNCACIQAAQEVEEVEEGEGQRIICPRFGVTTTTQQRNAFFLDEIESSTELPGQGVHERRCPESLKTQFGAIDNLTESRTHIVCSQSLPTATAATASKNYTNTCEW